MRYKKRVIFLSPIPPPYIGPTLATQVILNSKLKKEFNLIHLDTSDHRELNTLGKIDFDNIYLALKHYITLLWYILKIWPALIYIPISQTTKGYFRDSIFILIAKLYNRKVICQLRGGDFKNWYKSRGRFIQYLVKHIHSLVDGQIVMGENLKCLFSEFIREDRIFVVPNGKNIEFKTLIKKKSDKIVVLFLSNFIREKGILNVLGAASEVYLAHSNYNIEFAFAGGWFDTGTKLEFEKFLQKNSYLPIKLIGPVFGKNKYDLLISSDIFIFPPISSEGHPWVIIEAMAAGLPIITTNQGAICQSVINGENGFVIEESTPQEISEKVIFLIENPDIRRRMGEESRRLYLENFTEDKMAERLSYAFRAVLEF